ncbi:MAG: LamG domain-containing protein, partial [Pirellulales bacterium]|nr:LamG domain-containing protein [Pirellulales bacterium]
KVMVPPEQAAIVLWFDATRAGQETVKATSLSHWIGRTSIAGLRASKGHAPRWEPAATTLKQPAVRFGPLPTVMRMDSPEALQFGTGDFTISALFRVDPAAGGDNQILGKDSFSGGNSYTGFFFQHRAEQLRFSTRDLKAGKGPANYLDSKSRLRKGAWHRVTGMRRAGVLSLFLGDGDNADATMREAVETNVNNSQDFKLGEMDETLSGAMNGQIAEVLVFKRALNPEEVYQVHQYLQQKYLVVDDVAPLEKAMADFCQALFCLNEFIYVE